MPISFCFKKTQNFFETDIVSYDQTQLIDSENSLGISEGNGSTSMVFQNDISISKQLLKKYLVNHDFKVKKSGKVFDQYFNFYFSPKEFDLYYDKTNSISIFRAPKKISQDFIVFLKDKHDYSFKDIKIDFKKVTAKVEAINGIWIKVDKQEINNQAFFGSKVENDPEVVTAINKGKISYAVVRFPYKGDFELVGISKFGNIVVYNHGLTEKNELELVYFVYDKIINW
uniref:hypothetical protein n=1 Tax=Enterococcus faecalis TaxID=1351 RepID=UPI00359C42A7